MRLLNEKQFYSKKESDTLVIYGSGYSINNLSKDKIEKFKEFDSIGFNWFCKSGIPTTFYMLREQTTPSQRNVYRGEGHRDLLKDLKNAYKDSCLIVIDMKESSNAWRGKRGWSIYTDYFSNDGVVLKERYYKYYKEKQYESFFGAAQNFNIFEEHVMYATCSMSIILNIATWLRYNCLIFVGIDLYDHRYFWLKKNELRERTKRIKRKLNKKHFTSNVTLKMVRDLHKMNPNIKLYVENPKSLLTEIIPTWK